MFLDSRDKSLIKLKLCRNDHRKWKNKGRVLIAESADISQKAQFGLVMDIFKMSKVFFSNLSFLKFSNKHKNVISKKKEGVNWS